ncbi:MAG: hypothetical protein M3O24_00780, partial [Thermoproteota archaeon]|nr:hypothetical protein [Thermoproteota archaeon]
FLNDEIIEINVDKRIVSTRANKKVEYDYLIIALGSDFAPEKPGRVHVLFKFFLFRGVIRC